MTEAVAVSENKLPLSIKIIGFVTAVLGIAPSFSIVIFFIFAFGIGLTGRSEISFSPINQLLIAILFGHIFVINAATSIIGLFILSVLDGFIIFHIILGIGLLNRNNIAWVLTIMANIFLVILYLVSLIIAISTIGNKIILFTSFLWPVWSVFVIWKLYKHKLIFGE